MRFLPLASLVLAFVASTAHAQENESRKAASQKITGMQDYAAYCASCHGKGGAGDGALAATSERPVPSFTTPAAVVRYSYDRMRRGVEGAHGEDTRKAWAALSDDRIGSVVSYMREAFMLPAQTEDASRGRAIFARTCSVCHGDKGNGATWAKNSLNPSPFDFTSAKAKELSRRHMINTVTYGSPKTAMMGFSTKLSRSDIAAVVDYIRGTFVFPAETPENGKADAPIARSENGRQDHAALPSAHSAVPSAHAALPNGHAPAAAPAAAPPAKEGGSKTARVMQAVGPADMTLPMPNRLKGDAAAGKTLFDETCATCHGKEGNGQGPRAYFINPRPADFQKPEAREDLNRPTLFKAISDGVLGSEMPAWSKVLDQQQIANVAEYVFNAFIQPSGAVPAAPQWNRAAAPAPAPSPVAAPTAPAQPAATPEMDAKKKP